jgi:hypothetical protein
MQMTGLIVMLMVYMIATSNATSAPPGVMPAARTRPSQAAPLLLTA